jgi:SNF2 family DNA or RNA helicase
LIVLHAIWENLVPGKLHIWAETSDAETASAKRAGKIDPARKLHPHPFALTAGPLIEILEELHGSLLGKSLTLDGLALRIPSNDKAPLSSPELLLDTARFDDPNAAELRWWNVVTASLDPAQALDFLLALPVTAPPGVAFGSSLRFWTVVANFAFEMISRQSFAPILQEEKRGNIVIGRAAWDVVLAPEDAARVQVLARTMPPVCWSYMPPGDKQASLLPDMLHHFLQQTIDAYVRGSLNFTSLLPTSRSKRRISSLPLYEQWLHALSSSDPTFTSSASEMQQFSTLMHTWLDQLHPASAQAPFRTCFRLEAPPEEEEHATLWRLSFYLQANDDPSLLVPAEQVWQERSDTLTFLEHKFAYPQERLLADLGKAARLFPLLERSLREAHPCEVYLHTEQAYAFLRESVPLLEQSSFGVLIPPWWQKRTARVGVKLKVKSKDDAPIAPGLLGLNSIVDYKWHLAIGDQDITPEEFEQLAQLKLPLVKIRGQWVELRPDEIEAAIAFFEKKRARKAMSLGEALRIGLGEGVLDAGLPVLGLETEGWIKEVMEKLAEPSKLTPIEHPSTLQGQLRPYQLRGVSWLAFLKQYGFGACLADDMGLGKTLELIGLLLHEAALHEHAEHTVSPTLLICPMSIVGNWQRELQRFAPSLNVMVHHGLERLSGETFIEQAQQHDMVITTYALTWRDREHLGAVNWGNVVLDEAQNIKNESARQTQAIKSLPANYRIALTGTPVENRLSELWSIMEFLNPGYLGSSTDFRQRFAIPIERYHDAERSDTLKHLIQPFVLRRVKTDKAIIQDLPDKMEMKVFCNLTSEQASLYEAALKEMLEKIEETEGMARRGLIFATLLKLKQICNHPVQFLADSSSLPRRSGKLARLEEMLSEVLAEGDKALIFTQFAEMGELLRRYLQEKLGCETLFLHGGTAKKQRDLFVQRFQEERRGAPLFILSLKAGGVGLNLTAANHVFHFDRWWNPAVENQATDRAFRIGQQKNVLVHKFVCVGTLEERIDQMIEQKKELAENIVGTGENWLTEMSTSQLKELFTLSREAVGE